eukprot:6957993-Prymnesium_polylepis.1
MREGAPPWPQLFEVVDGSTACGRDAWLLSFGGRAGGLDTKTRGGAGGSHPDLRRQTFVGNMHVPYLDAGTV